ncbi:MAG: tyrosine-protein phosphatase [Hyphomicrobiales bacterium]|nr:tyrosine-protein phosphatase [Hyphomicrobiales bacterium]MCA1999751.1 tyrosine-protein phosphatase [Hyphomicrobiales bacterium]
MPRLPRTVEYYTARREKREARWNRAIETPGERLRAWLDLLIVDHGVLRLFHLNRHRVGRRLWRSAQPSPRDIARLAREGLRTIVNLRGGRAHGAWQLEKDAAQRHGITIVDLVLRSREAPDRATLLALPDFFAGLAYPALAHCKSGADRAGLFAALYLLVVEKAEAARALRELSLRKGHFRYAQTGILDAFLEAYRDEGEARGKAFMDWVREDYDPEALKARFRPRPLASLVVDLVLRRE